LSANPVLQQLLVAIRQITPATIIAAFSVVIAYLAWRQHRTNRLMVKVAAFGPRYALYMQIAGVLRNISRGEVTTAELWKLWEEKERAALLVGKDLEKYIESLYRRGVRIQDKISKFQGDDFRKSHALVEEQEWAAEQLIELGKKFKKPLDLSKL
jgi:hypothetical protein